MVYYQSNASSYILQQKAKYIFDSDQEQQYQFCGTNFIRTQKSMSMMTNKQNKPNPNLKDMKKSNSFLLNKSKTQKNGTAIQNKNKEKDKSKTSKKSLNITEANKKPPINSKSSMNKTSVSINSICINNANSSTNKSIKGMKKRSISQDYLILNDQIYHCDNIEEINQKLVCGTQNTIYSHQRFIKATLKNQQRLRNYLCSFKQFIKFSNRNSVNIAQMSNFQKKKLYELLKSQTTIHSSSSLAQIQNQNKKQILQNSFSMQNLIKQAVGKIQKKADQIIYKRPSQQIQIRKWKNQKLHDLMTIHTYLNQDSIHMSSQRQSLSLPPEQFSEECSSNKPYQLILQNQQIINLSNQTVNPKLSQHRHNGNKYIIQQKYHFSQKLIEQEKQRLCSYLPQQHILSVYGIENFLHLLWDYLVDHELIPELVSNMRKPYTLSESDKRLLMEAGQENVGQWTAYILLKYQTLLNDQVFVNFQKANKFLSAQQFCQFQKYQIIFQKSIFDSLNQQLSKFQTDYPYGQFHPLENNPNHSAYIIDEQNAMQAWDQCIYNIITNSQLSLGSLVEQQTQAITMIIKQKYEKGFKTWVKLEDQLRIYQRIQPLTYRKTIQSIISHVQNQLIQQLIKTLNQLE